MLFFNHMVGILRAEMDNGGVIVPTEGIINSYDGLLDRPKHSATDMR